MRKKSDGGERGRSADDVREGMGSRPWLMLFLLPAMRF